MRLYMEEVNAFQAAMDVATADNTTDSSYWDIALYATDSTVWVVTQNNVYQSVDAGTISWGNTDHYSGGQLITSLDVALDKTDAYPKF